MANLNSSGQAGEVALTTLQLATALQCDTQHVRKMARETDIPFYDVSLNPGKSRPSYRFLLSEVAEWIKNRKK